jgi:hypothetical protein
MMISIILSSNFMQFLLHYCSPELKPSLSTLRRISDPQGISALTTRSLAPQHAMGNALAAGCFDPPDEDHAGNARRKTAPAPE